MRGAEQNKEQVAKEKPLKTPTGGGGYLVSDGRLGRRTLRSVRGSKLAHRCLTKVTNLSCHTPRHVLASRVEERLSHA